MSIQAQIQKLADLHASNVISEEEFSTRRAALIDGFVGKQQAHQHHQQLANPMAMAYAPQYGQTSAPGAFGYGGGGGRGYGGAGGGRGAAIPGQQAPPSAGIGLFNLPWATTQPEVEGLVGQFPGLQRVHMVTDKATGRFKGYAFAYFSSIPAATAAKQGLTGLTLGTPEAPWHVDVKYAADGSGMGGARAAPYPTATPYAPYPQQPRGFMGGKGKGFGGRGLARPKVIGEAAPSNGIGLFNLPWATTEEEFKGLVSQFPGLTDVKMVSRPDGSFKGFAFAYYDSVESATAAKTALTGLSLNAPDGTPMAIDVKFAVNDSAPKPAVV